MPILWFDDDDEQRTDASRRRHDDETPTADDWAAGVALVVLCAILALLPLLAP